MKKQLMVSALLLSAVACIGWNSDQREVVDSYNTLMEDASQENWHGLARGFSDETADLLDDIAVIYTAAGAPFNNQGEELLASLVSETDFLVFSDVVVSVEFRNEKAYLLSEQGGDVRSYEFIRDGSRWKLNLVQDLTQYFNEAMQGTGLPSGSSDLTDSPTYISTGSGSCEFALRNDLEHLSIWNVYCSPGNSDSWGEDWLQASILGSGSEMGIWLESGVYDIRVVDSDDNVYTLWQIELDEDGVFWPVTALDRDELD
ncbi:MAG: hypothetical protein J7K88_12855 [Candidatus Fermentibacteraceae bacterium]|nr:hypothetical protein [Candidatus Fermentibacteraceae bacterium]